MSIAPISSIVPLTPNTIQGTAPSSPTTGNTFAAILGDLIKSNNEANAGVDKAITALATGEAQDLHSVGIAVAQADLNFRLILQIRNRVTEALQEVLRTQI